MHSSQRRITSKEEWEERRRLYGERWRSLPNSARVPGQLAGRAAVGCGATHHVMERCNFSCTCCYLGPQANQTEPLPFEDVAAQLDEIRRRLGPRGKTQITAGEVTLLPVDELGRIVAYARSIGLDPMVMTHGQRFLDEPEYLKRLVQEYGLEKISIHIDTTQRGRRSVGMVKEEGELTEVREQFATLIRDVRHETGCRLSAASTITVTEDNVEQLADVVNWFYRNADAFRLLSFQPVANVGRTRRLHESAQVRDVLWKQVNRASGRPINEAPLSFGHPECNRTVPLLIVRSGERVRLFESVRSGNQFDANVLSEAIDVFGNRVRWAESLGINVWRTLVCLLKHPRFLLKAVIYGIVRLVSEWRFFWGVLLDTVLKLKRTRASIFLFVVHSFMDAKEMDTDIGKERLDACVFKVPVDGRFVSMCEMNASELRRTIDSRLRKKKPSSKVIEEPGR
ncbi:hypothetical protein MLD52_06535 [Puniceicoccaceae bacterium K14]|nr:hypothetical protein [Puniceicoccaceae bacterium K14]